MSRPKPQPISDDLRALLREQLKSRSLGDVAAAAGVHHETLRKAINGSAIRPATAARLLRVSPRVRTAAEFAGAAATFSAPYRWLGARSHDSQDDALEWIRSARDSQIVGKFRTPVELARRMRSDDALYTAYNNRLAPHEAIASELRAHDSTRGASVLLKAREYCVAPRAVLQGILGTMANHGLAVGQVHREPNDAGTVVGFRLTEWPLEYVEWDSSEMRLRTQTRDCGTVPITHGDGQWIVFKKFDDYPWLHEAAILPASFVYAVHAEGLADWAGASRSHGLAKIMGMLPQGVAMRQSDGTALTAEAEAYLSMLGDLVSGEASVGVQAFGGDAKVLANGSTAWQVFAELIMNRERAAARIYTGTDAYLGSIGDAPGIDIAHLFGVMTTKVQGDFRALSSGLDTGFYQPWTAINYGDSRYAPSHVYLMPDPDEQAKQEHNAAAYDRLIATLRGMREQRLEVTQETVNALAAAFGVSPVPRLAAANEAASTLDLAPTDVAKVIRVREARSSRGFPPFGDERDDMTLTELDERNKAKAQVDIQTALRAAIERAQALLL